MSNRFLFTGTGGSLGVPVIGCTCDTCISPLQENKRLRTAGVLTLGGKKIIVDMGPDFRTQALQYGITHVDGLILTHAHYDHIAGIDEIRVYCFKQKHPIPCLLLEHTYNDIFARCRYMFPPFPGDAYPCEKLACTIVGSEGKVEFLDRQFHYTTFWQYTMPVLGWRVGNFAYLTDIQTYNDSIFPFLKGVTTLVISAVRIGDTKTHFTLHDAICFAQKVGARRTFLTHLSHEIEHYKTQQMLPEGIYVAFDGLEVEID